MGWAEVLDDPDAGGTRTPSSPFVLSPQQYPVLEVVTTHAWLSPSAMATAPETDPPVANCTVAGEVAFVVVPLPT